MRADNWAGTLLTIAVKIPLANPLLSMREGGLPRIRTLVFYSSSAKAMLGTLEKSGTRKSRAIDATRLAECIRQTKRKLYYKVRGIRV